MLSSCALLDFMARVFIMFLLVRLCVQASLSETVAFNKSLLQKSKGEDAAHPSTARCVAVVFTVLNPSTVKCLL